MKSIYRILGIMAISVAVLLCTTFYVQGATVVFPQVENNGITTLDGSLSDSATTINVVSVAALGLSGATTDAYVTIVDAATRGFDPLVVPETSEIVRITSISSNALTVTRGVDGTSAKAFSDGDIVELRIIAVDFDRVYDALTDGTDSINVSSIDSAGVLTMSAGAVIQNKGTDIPSATDLVVTTTGNFFDVTGTITIASIQTMGVGAEITLQFDNVLQLTNHATNLILPGGANITTVAGDTAIFREYAVSDWVCISYQSGITNGDVTSGSTITDNSIVRGDGGVKGIQQSGILIDDSNVMTGGNVGAMTVSRIAGSTFSTVQDLQTVFHSAGVSTGGGFTDDTDGTITVATGTGFIRSTNSATGELFFTDWASEAGANVALTDNDMNFIYVEYNAGSPQVIATISKRTDEYTNVLLGTVYRAGTTLHFTETTRVIVGDHALQMIVRLRETVPFMRVSGGIISETGTQNIAITAGSWWEDLTRFSTTAQDTSVADTFDYYYSDGAGGFTIVASQTQIHNTNYDDGDGVLGTLSNNRFGVHWVYITQDDEFDVVYGTTDGTLQQANDAGEPSSVPPHFDEAHARLVGKVIIAKSATSFTSIQSSFNSTFSLHTASDHGGLTGLADDDHTQYAQTAGDTFTGSVNIDPNAWSFGAVNANADDFYIQDNVADVGITIQSLNTGEANVYFGDSNSSVVGRIVYNNTSGNTNDEFQFFTNSSERFTIANTITSVMIGDFDVVAGDLLMSAGMINERKGADVASATALPLLTDGNFFDVTGTTTITSFNSVGIGAEVTLQFDAGLTLTHHATNLILPAGANIATTAGDVGKFREYASGDFVLVSWQSAIGAGTGDALIANPLSQFAATTSAQLAGVLSNETGTGLAVFGTSPALTTPTGIVTSDVTESTDKNFVTDAEGVVIGNTSGTNTGDTPVASQTWVIDSPAVGGVYGARIDTARTIDRIEVWTDTGTVDINVEERTAPNTSGTNTMTADLQGTSTSANQTTFANDAIAAGNWLYLDISAVASSPTVLGVTVSYE